MDKRKIDLKSLTDLESTFSKVDLNIFHNNKIFTLQFLFSFSIVILIPLNPAFAFDDGFFWDPPGEYPFDRGVAGSGKFNIFEIKDMGLESNGISNENLSVKVESIDKDDHTVETLNLVLTEKNDEGLFGIEHIVFMEGDWEFDVSDKVIVNLVDNCLEISDTTGNCDPNKIEKLLASEKNAVKIFSDTDPVGFAIDLVETGPDTGVFEGTVLFSLTDTDSTNHVLHVSSGDRITAKNQDTGAVSNGLISGNPNRYAIQARVFGTVEVTATPSGTNVPITDVLTLNTPSGGGSGSGGFRGPGLVRDSVSSGASGCNECQPPTLGVNSENNRLVSNGFSYNDNPVDVNLFYTPYPLVTVKVGEENKAVLKIYENSGPENIEHVGIGFGLGKGQSFSQSKATINVDRILGGEYVTSTYDPENVFDNIKVNHEIGNCGVHSDSQCMIFTIFHTFREPLKFNIVATYVWDVKGNAWQNYYNHGVHVFGDSINPPKTKLVAFGTNEMRGLFTLTQTDKLKDQWIDALGNTYQHKGNDRFDKISTIPKNQVYDSFTMHGCDRLCDWFENYKLYQEILAKKELEKILDGKEIVNEQKGFVAPPPYSKIQRSGDIMLQNAINEEIMKANEIFNGFGIKNNF